MKQYPVLYSPSETLFSSNGVGVLQDATRCRVTEELNGLFELEMTYPANGVFHNEISERSIICAEASEDLGVQPFRVYRVVKSLTGNILIYARHISYDLSGIPVSPFHLGNDQDWSDVGTVTDAFAKIVQNSVVTNPFTFSSTVTDEKEMDIKIPMSARALLLGSENSVVSIFGGDFKFEKYNVYHTARRGTDRGFSIRYGVNMTALNQDENTEPFYTGIYPFYSDNDGTIEIDGKIIRSPGAHGFERIKVVDLTQEFTEAPWYPAEVEAKAREWIAKNGFGLPKISLDVGFAQLRKSEEYKDLRILEDVNLGDDVQVYFEKIGVSSTARVTKTVWDALEHRYISIHLGDASQSIANTIGTNIGDISAGASRIAKNEKSISAKVSSSGGDNSSFGWELTTTEWALYSNNEKVLSATDDGLDVKGKIIAESGGIADFDIGATSLHKTSESSFLPGQINEVTISSGGIKFSQTYANKELSAIMDANGFSLHKENLYGVVTKFPIMNVWLGANLYIEVWVDQNGALGTTIHGNVQPI